MKHNLNHAACSLRNFAALCNRWAICLLVLVLASAVPSLATTITVTNTNDDGEGSLRQAVYDLNNQPTADIDAIDFSPSVRGTIFLTGPGSLATRRQLTITGPGAGLLTIEGNHKDPVFEINSCFCTRIVISGLTIRGGGHSGIINRTRLDLIDMVVSGNASEGNGGGVANEDSLEVIHSTVSGNKSAKVGGGINNTGHLLVVDSTIAGNSAVVGGGINDFAAEYARVTNTTISGNTAGIGAAVASDFGRFVLINSTVAGNTNLDEGPTAAAIYNGNNSQVVLINSTVANNKNGGIFNPVTLKGTLLANNGVNCKTRYRGSQSVGYNISDDDSCSGFMTNTGDENKVNPGGGLDPNGLGNNGGPTQTIALLPESPAVDRIPVEDCTLLESRPVKITTDQRGILRPQGSACDTGAFELVQGGQP